MTTTLHPATATPPRPWLPLLEGDAAEHALTVCEEIAGALLALGLERDFALGEMAGWSVFLAYLDRALPGRGYDERALELLDASIAEIGRSAPHWGLHTGIPGIAWAVEHLTGWLVDQEEEDPGEEVAESLRRLLDRKPWRGDHDLILGLAGLAVYALERLPRSGGRECLEAVVAHLTDKAERRPEGVVWRTLPIWMVKETAELYPEGKWDLGVAHGVSGVISALAQAHAAGAGARPLLDQAVAWLLAQRLPPGERSAFPHVAAPGRPPQPTRLGWCYGDLGISAALLVAARAVGEPAWEREALKVARGAAQRPPETSGVKDAAFCHGAAGNGHIFNRLFQATGDPLFEQAARYWLGQAFALRRPGTGVAGYSAWDPGDGAEPGWRDDPTLVSGAAGTGLCLLAAASPVEPAWDRLFLISAR